jgi:hypothetical protein
MGALQKKFGNKPVDAEYQSKLADYALTQFTFKSSELSVMANEL